MPWLHPGKKHMNPNRNIHQRHQTVTDSGYIPELPRLSRPTHRRSFCSVILLVFFLLRAGAAFASHGASIDGVLKYPPGFTAFAYTAATAKKGGHLYLHALGSFDKMNPFTLRGAAPEGLESLVFETLAAPSLDEPFAQYGLIASDIAVAPDRLSVTFTINPRARFSDGSPLTPADVKYSFDTLKSGEAHPFYRIYLRDIMDAEIIPPDKVVFHFSRVNRELHLLVGQIPIFSEKFYQQHDFDSANLTPPLGSGPYMVEKVSEGKAITYRRNPDYWGRDLPCRKNQFNFDRITYRYYKDQIVSLEAFKAGEFDFMPINISKQWVRDVRGKNFDSGELARAEFPHHNNQGMQCFVMNERRPLFTDRRVRRAIALAFDFNWTNSALFFGQYRPSSSFFNNSDLAATGLPSPAELKLLQPFRDKLPPEVFTIPPTPITTVPPHSRRGNLLMARNLLRRVGWRVKNGQLEKDGRVFAFDILLVSPSFERVMGPFVKNLARLGIRAAYRTVDPSLYTRRVQNFDYDMVVTVFGQSQSPGNEQRNYFHSSSRDRKGSRNLIGLADPVVDAMVEKVINAATTAELKTACRALDRVLWYGYHVVPNWYIDHHRIAYRDIFGRPRQLPTYYSPEQLLMTWWYDPATRN